MRNDKCDRRLFCDDYKYYHCDGCNGNKISSEDFIKAFGNGVKEDINHVPTVEERPHGEWLYPYADNIIGKRRIGRSWKVCSICKQSFTNNIPWNANFCPNCGADMRGN